MISQSIDPVIKHYQSYSEILEAQEQNFQTHLQRLSLSEKQWWFKNISVTSLSDLDRLPVRTPADILNEQIKNPPFGLFTKGQYVFTSSGSTGHLRKTFPYILENYHRVLVGPARVLENHGVDHRDTVMSTDNNGMFSGHSFIEDAATMFLGTTRIRCSSPMLSDKLNFIKQYHVTVFSGSPTKLHRLAKLNPKKFLTTPLKMVISTGGVLENQEFIAEAFGVERITNMYGAAEIGNIAWTCKHGHFHVNIDLCHIRDNKYVSNLTSLPIFNYKLGEEIEFSYKGTCACGSNLPTIDCLTVDPTADRSKKD